MTRLVLAKGFNYQGHHWTALESEDNLSFEGKYVVACRTPSNSEISKSVGGCASKIDILLENLPKRVLHDWEVALNMPF